MGGRRHSGATVSIEDLTGTVVRKICMACSREFAGSGGVCPHDGNMLVPLPQDPYVGRRIADKYHVISVLGTGGMGVVYLARHETMQCNVAIKMLRAQFVGDQTSVKRFTQEAIAARRLQHPNVITTYDHGFTQQGQPYIVMDCLQGKSLADEIKRTKGLPVERVLHIFMQACDALDHAHKQGVIHRDLKPGNIMLINYEDDPDFVKVVDFGVAKIMPLNDQESQTLTQAGEVCGSPVYMSPEQCVGQSLDRRADIYSMGVVLYEALTGKLPLIGKNMVETMHKHLNEKPPSFQEVRPDLYIPEKVEAVVMKALSKAPDMRQQSMAMLRQELNFCVPRPGQNQSLRSFSSSTSEFQIEKKTNWLVPALSAAAATIVAGGAAFYFMSQKPAPSNLPPQAVTTPVQTTTPASQNPNSGTSSKNPVAAEDSHPAQQSDSPGKTTETSTGAASIEPKADPEIQTAHATIPVAVPVTPVSSAPKVIIPKKPKLVKKTPVHKATATVASAPPVQHHKPAVDPFEALKKGHSLYRDRMKD